MCELDPDIDYDFRGGARGYHETLAALDNWLNLDWQVIETGGGCLAIWNNTLLEGGLRVYITDRQDVLSDWRYRVKSCHNGEPVGWGVGVYSATDDYCEARGLGESYDNHADVPAIVRAALDDYQRHGGAQCFCWQSDYNKTN